MAAAIAGVAFLPSISLAEIKILSPDGKDSVCAIHRVAGSISVREARETGDRVWVIVEPTATPGRYFVQAPAIIPPGNDTWSTDVHFGEHGQHIGAQYRVWAITTHVELHMGPRRTFPQTTSLSQALSVTRGPLPGPCPPQ